MNEIKLKIGITCYPSIGGSGIVATQLGNELAKRGHEVHFISYEVPFRLEGGANVYYHKVKLNEYSLFKYPDYTLPLAVKMCDVAQKNRLDIMHVHYAVPHATAAVLARNICQCQTEPCKTKVVTTLHGTDITLVGRDPSLHAIVQYSIEESCGVTAVSQYLKNETYKVFPIKKEIEVIYNFYAPKAVTKSREVMRRSLGLSEDDVLAIHLSNLRPVKRIPDLLHVFARALSLNQHFKLLVLAGSSWTPFESLVRELNIADRVLVKENVRSIENYLSAADVGLYTSEDETFGMGILETMSMGLPVVSTNAGGVPEVVEDDTTGILKPVGDIEGIAEAVVGLSHDTSLRRRLGDHARERAESLFSADKIVAQYEEYYRGIIR